jgi:3-oxoacyl-(acyl-carrier-protein) synthase
MTVSNGCTAGIDAVAFGYETILDGEADVMLAGAAESPVSPISLACFDPIKATSRRNDDPARASRPFDRDRDGFTIGEGAAMLVLEEQGHARRRGARVYAEVLGYAGVCNAYHMTGLESHGRDMAKAIRLALDQAGLEPEAIGYINAHGSSTAQNDVHETAAFKEALGDHAYRVPISSIKSMIGHSLGAIGAIEMACCALVVDRGILPPTINYENPDPLCDLDYVPNVAREQRVDVVLSTGSGFGGFQSAMLFGRAGVVR